MHLLLWRCDLTSTRVFVILITWPVCRIRSVNVRFSCRESEKNVLEKKRLVDFAAERIIIRFVLLNYYWFNKNPLSC